MKKIILSLSILAILIVGLSGCDFFNTTSTIVTTKTTSETTLSSITSTTITSTSGSTISHTASSLDKVYFMSINDTHGQLFENVDDGYMSIAQVEADTEYLEKEAGQKYIRICCGDLFQGSYVSRLTNGKCFIDALNAANFNVMVLGNHEFDWGLDTIKIYWDGDSSNGEANFPLLCANLKDGNGNRPSWVSPYAIIDYSGIKVGIIGTIGENLESDIAASSLGSYTFDGIYSYVKEYSKELRSMGCSVVVLATHDYTSSTFQYLVDNLPVESRIDAIFGGHTHVNEEEYYTYSKTSYKVPAIESITKSKDFGTICLNLNENDEAISGTFSHFYKNYFSGVNPSEAVTLAVSSYLSVQEQGDEVVGYFQSEVSGKSGVANWMCLAMMDKFNADLGFVNAGGVRVYSFAQGNITMADVYEAFPFDNYCVTCTMTGAKLLSYINSRSDLLANSSYDSSAIISTKIYTVVTCDYVANASSNYMASFTTDGVLTTHKNYMRDVLAEYLKKTTLK